MQNPRKIENKINIIIGIIETLNKNANIANCIPKQDSTF